MGTSPVILFTGDLLGHNIPQSFCYAYSGINPNSGATCPPLSPAGVADMQQFMDKTVTFVAEQIRVAAGNVPVLYVVGNIDTYSGGYGPDSTFLSNNAGTIYIQFLNGSVDQQTFQSTFTADGYYSAQPLGSKLLVIGLNTNSFAAEGAGGTEATAELGWLDSQLSAAQAAGQHVWILMHVPPGTNSQATAPAAAQAGTPNYVDNETTSMMWEPGYQESFMEKLAKYPSVVTLMLAGHTHMDEYRIMPTGNVLEQLPGISPCFGNNPAFKVLTITQDTFVPIDYESFAYDLASSTAPTQFDSLYQMSTSYGAQGSLNYSLESLYPWLIGGENQRLQYIYYFSSGSTAINPKTNAPFNPINNVTWPIFACTISKTAEPDYIDCVDTYCEADGPDRGPTVFGDVACRGTCHPRTDVSQSLSCPDFRVTFVFRGLAVARRALFGLLTAVVVIVGGGMPVLEGQRQDTADCASCLSRGCGCRLADRRGRRLRNPVPW